MSFGSNNSDAGELAVVGAIIAGATIVACKIADCFSEVKIQTNDVNIEMKKNTPNRRSKKIKKNSPKKVGTNQKSHVKRLPYLQNKSNKGRFQHASLTDSKIKTLKKVYDFIHDAQRRTRHLQSEIKS